MHENNSFNRGSDSTQADTKHAIREFKNSSKFIQDNWTDDLGKKFFRLLQNVEMELTKLEHRKVVLSDNISTLRNRMYEIACDDDDEPVPVKKKVLTSTGGEYPAGSGGFSRGRW